MRRFERSRRKSHPRSRAVAATPDGWAYGARAVAELLDAAPDAVVRILATADSARRLNLAERQPQTVSRDELTALLGTDAHQGVAAEIRPFAYATLAALDAVADGVVVVLDHVEDPHNVGAIARSAVVFGARALVIAHDRAAQVTAGVIKSSAGAIFRLPVVRVVNIAETARHLAAQGFTVVGADANEGAAPREVDFGTRTALILGAERRGLRHVVRAACTAIVRIPQATNAVPLNVSNAAAVLLYARFVRT